MKDLASSASPNTARIRSSVPAPKLARNFSGHSSFLPIPHIRYVDNRLTVSHIRYQSNGDAPMTAQQIATRYADVSLEQLRAEYARAQRIAEGHAARGLHHFAELCRGRAAELAGEILTRDDTL
jgi:hypothetical protein